MSFNINLLMTTNSEFADAVKCPKSGVLCCILMRFCGMPAGEWTPYFDEESEILGTTLLAKERSFNAIFETWLFPGYSDETRDERMRILWRGWSTRTRLNVITGYGSHLISAVCDERLGLYDFLICDPVIAMTSLWHAIDTSDYHAAIQIAERAPVGFIRADMTTLSSMHPIDYYSLKARAMLADALARHYH